MNILLTGASGFIGRNLVQVLTAAGHRIVPASRREGVDFMTMQTAEQWLPWLVDIDVVVNAVGIIGETHSQSFAALHAAAPMALFDACREAGVGRVIQISALGADRAAFSAYHLSKRAADDHLRQLDLDWFVLRPSLLYGRGGSSARMFMQLARCPLLPVIGDGRQRLQPVQSPMSSQQSWPALEHGKPARPWILSATKRLSMQNGCNVCAGPKAWIAPL